MCLNEGLDRAYTAHDNHVMENHSCSKPSILTRFTIFARTGKTLKRCS